MVTEKHLELLGLSQFQRECVDALVALAATHSDACECRVCRGSAACGCDWCAGAMAQRPTLTGDALASALAVAEQRERLLASLLDRDPEPEPEPEPEPARPEWARITETDKSACAACGAHTAIALFMPVAGSEASARGARIGIPICGECESAIRSTSLRALRDGSL